MSTLELQSKPKIRNVNLSSNENNNATTFIWHVENFEMCPDKWGKSIESPEFSIYKWQSSKFHLLLYAGGVNKKSSKYLSVYIVKTSNEDEDFTYSCKLGIVTNKDWKTCCEFSQKIGRNNGQGSAEFFDREKFQSPEIFLPDGHLSLFCEIKIRGIENKMSMHAVKKSDPKRNLSNIYADIYESKNFCDLYLHVGDTTFKVHKEIIKARFPDLLQNIDGNKCKIKSIGSITMNALLHYVYTGTLNISEINLFEIISSNYKLPSHLKYLLIEKQNKIEVTTSFQKITMSFSWDIRNFNTLDSSKVIHYSLIGDYNLKWTWFDLFLSVTKDETGDDYITITIQRISENCKRIVCMIKTADVSKSFNHTYDKEDKWMLPSIAFKDIFGDNLDTIPDVVSFNFEIIVSDGSKTDKVNGKEFILHPSKLNQIVEDLFSLREDIKNILDSPKYCDTILVSGNDKFPAHKFILSARSSIFCERFQSESAKKKNSELLLNDFDASVIKDMLAYMYCNEVKFSKSETKHIHNVCLAASEYDIPGLEKECVDYLKSNLSAETAGDILISAHKWNDDKLKKSVYDYVCSHPLEIANCSEWREVMLRRSDLATEVLTKTLSYFSTKVETDNSDNDCSSD